MKEIEEMQNKARLAPWLGNGREGTPPLVRFGAWAAGLSLNL